ncbi:spore maturation protein [[Clostridium] fimetarium]|uniref:Spore maturation protein B n=1 Tax=[Clostridium] fimetarium TaxID=99656 RepID=A0A1I0QSP9_9FIRM|nr:nucleoside recognition domain-containing protein [[Clostridium] fimetarium]SEW30581.1 spore maturation protein B [[Clostridium] fimetarium]
MNRLVYMSQFIIPLVIFYIVGYGMLNKTNVYDDFVEGAKDGMKTVIGIMPTLIGLMVAVGILRSSGFLNFLAHELQYITDKISFPAPLVPVILMRMFSSSAATGLTLDIFKEYGTDSYIGLLTSIIMSCTEAVFYVMSVYFIAAGVKKTRWTLPGALLATVAGIVASVVITKMIV